MSKAHDLLALLNLTVSKGATGRYPAASEGPNPEMRYWATELNGDGVIQFGVQMRRAGQTIPLRVLRSLQPLGFRLRPHGRELVLDLPGTVASAKLAADKAIRQLQSLPDEALHDVADAAEKGH